MKKIVFALLVLPIFAISQEDYNLKGNNKIGLHISPEFYTSFPGTSLIHDYGLRYERMVIDKLAIGPEVGYLNDDIHSGYTLGFFSRYYLQKKKISPFIEINADYFHYKYIGDPLIYLDPNDPLIPDASYSNSSTILAGGVGLSINDLLGKLGVDVMIGYEDVSKPKGLTIVPSGIFEGTKLDYNFRIFYKF